jgi:DNA-binding transcriptional MerR regulator
MVSGRKTPEKIDFTELRTIGDVAATLDLPAHVLRFWETRFREIKPVKRAGGRRFYRPDDIVLVAAIRTLLYDDGYTIRGVQRLIREEGVEAIVARAEQRLAPEESVAEAPSPAPPVSPAPPYVEWPIAPQPVPAVSPPPDFPAAPAAVPTPPAVTGDRDARLRQALAEIEECRRLLCLTRR